MTMSEEQKKAMMEELKALAAAVGAGDVAAVAACLEKIMGMMGATEMKNDAPTASVDTTAAIAPDVPADKPVDEVAVSVAAKADGFAAQVYALTGKSDTAEVVGTLAAWKQSSIALSAANAELTKLRSASRAAEFEQVLADGKRAGKITPGMIAGEWITKLRAREDGVVELRSFLASAHAIVAPSANEPAAGGTTVALTADEAKIAQLVGNKPADALKTKERQLNAAK
jgi:hypothetical protein